MELGQCQVRSISWQTSLTFSWWPTPIQYKSRMHLHDGKLFPASWKSDTLIFKKQICLSQTLILSFDFLIGTCIPFSYIFLLIQTKWCQPWVCFEQMWLPIISQDWAHINKLCEFNIHYLELSYHKKAYLLLIQCIYHTKVPCPFKHNKPTALVQI